MSTTLILRFSPLVDSLPPIYPYTLEVLCFHLTILPWQSLTYPLTAFNNNHRLPIPLRRYHKQCASCRGSFSRSNRRKMERKKDVNYMCVYVQICVCVCEYFLAGGYSGSCGFCLDIIIVTLIHYFVYFARTEFNWLFINSLLIPGLRKISFYHR